MPNAHEPPEERPTSAPGAEQTRPLELSDLLPFPYNELFPLHTIVPLQPTWALRRDVFGVLLTEAEGLAWTCSWALRDEQARDDPDKLVASLGVLSQYLSKIVTIWRLIEAGGAGHA